MSDDMPTCQRTASGFKTNVKAERPLFQAGANEPKGVGINFVSIQHGQYGGEDEDEEEETSAMLAVIILTLPRSLHGSEPFVKACVRVVFSAVNPATDLDPQVKKIAPAGTNVYTGATDGARVAAWYQKKNGDGTQITVEGEIRSEGGRQDNMARWTVQYNEDKSDIPIQLRTSMCVQVPTGEFRAVVQYEGYTTEKTFGGDLLYPFPEGERGPKGPSLEGVDPEDMSSCDLDSL